MKQTLNAKIVKNTLSAQITADALEGDSVSKQRIVFLNHCGYDKLSCGGAVADCGCDSVFIISELVTEYSSRWRMSELVEVING